MLPKHEESRCQILHAARELIAAKGFNAITLQDILDAAQVTKGKFFHYFKGKDHLFEELLRYSMDERDIPHFVELVEECADKSPFTKLLFILDKMIEWHSAGLPEAMRLCVFATVFFSPHELEQRTEHLANNSAVVQKLIAESQQQGELPKSLDAATLSLLFPSAAIGANTVQFISGKKNLTPDSIRQLRLMLVELNKSAQAKTKGKS